jgi:hypothetical protein
MINFKCPHCGKDVSAGDEHAGKKGRCPGCKELFTIPAAAAKPAPAAERRTSPPANDEAGAPPKKKKGGDYDAADPEAVEELKRRVGVKIVKRQPDKDEDDLDVIDEAPRKKKPARDDEDDEAIAEAPRKKRPARDDEDEDDRPRKKRSRDEDDDEDEPRARKKRGRDDDEEDEDDRPRKKKKRRGQYADCPNCGCRGKATAVGFTWWGGILGPRLFSHVKCDRCGTCYNGKTGDYNTTKIAIYVGVSLVIVIALGIVGILAEH